jgi:RNA polymerase sigma factor (sigma-70 family)
MSKGDFFVDEFKPGNEQQITYLYLHNKPKFVQYAKQYKVDETTATDIYQDAVVALIEHAKKGKLVQIKSSASTYLFAIAKFMLFNFLKKEKQLFIATEEIDFEWTDDKDEYKDEQIQQMQHHFNSLGEQCKKLLTAFYYEEKKLDELVVLFGYDNKDVVKSQKSRCIKQLKTLIGK